MDKWDLPENIDPLALENKDQKYLALFVSESLRSGSSSYSDQGYQNQKKVFQRGDCFAV
jgi:hypothetical protein